MQYPCSVLILRLAPDAVGASHSPTNELSPDMVARDYRAFDATQDIRIGGFGVTHDMVARTLFPRCTSHTGGTAITN